METPNETELAEYFGAPPERKDETIEFALDTATFRFDNGIESFKVVISPFYNEFVLEVAAIKEQQSVLQLKLRSVEKIEIVEEPQEAAMIRIHHGRSESYIHTLACSFKPKFQMALHEQYL